MSTSTEPVASLLRDSEAPAGHGELVRSIHDLIVELRALPAAIAEALQYVDQPRCRALRDGEHVELVVLITAISAAVGNRLFTANELIKHAEDVEPALRMTLVQVVGVFDSRTARRIGKRLQRAEGQRLNGYQVERVKTERGGAVWRITAPSRVSLPHDSR
jgi:hypothetical protein